ncbi:hypothetical protein DFH06DRAFT_1149488 [Mycena polygramma]|nr:hypothetical protein DFH06DRAFT_1149488 [Mycena polygramma]
MPTFKVYCRQVQPQLPPLVTVGHKSSDKVPPPTFLVHQSAAPRKKVPPPVPPPLPSNLPPPAAPQARLPPPLPPPTTSKGTESIVRVPPLLPPLRAWAAFCGTGRHFHFALLMGVFPPPASIYCTENASGSPFDSGSGHKRSESCVHLFFFRGYVRNFTWLPPTALMCILQRASVRLGLGPFAGHDIF